MAVSQGSRSLTPTCGLQVKPPAHPDRSTHLLMKFLATRLRPSPPAQIGDRSAQTVHPRPSARSTTPHKAGISPLTPESDRHYREIVKVRTFPSPTTSGRTSGCLAKVLIRGLIQDLATPWAQCVVLCTNPLLFSRRTQHGTCCST